jgi:hypothetical protein
MSIMWNNVYGDGIKSNRYRVTEDELLIKKGWLSLDGINGLDDRKGWDGAFCVSSGQGKPCVQEGTQQNPLRGNQAAVTPSNF